MFKYGTDPTAFFIDNGEGKLSIVVSDSSNKFIVLKSNAGTINYDTGLVTVLPIAISSYSGQSLKMYARTFSKDFRSVRQTILQLNAEDIRVNVIQERI